MKFRATGREPRAHAGLRTAVSAGLCGLFFGLPAAHATTYYVATTGSDTAAGTQALPFRTIRKSITVAQAGDTVLIRGGTYTGFENQINPTRSGTATAYITFRASDGELPILEPPAGITGGSAFEPLDVAVQFIRVEGLAARNWPSSGFSNGFNHPSANIQVVHCIADNNGINGLAFYKASGVLFENNIVAHNGNLAPSWSSGVNLFTAGGSAQTNIVRGNVSFENIDICGNPSQHACDPARSTDGNGFILDQNSTGALFVNNIAFRNGGSCIRLTNSSGAELVNNSCFHNALDTGYDFLQTEVFFSDNTARTGASVRNNILAATSGINALNAAGAAVIQNNLSVDNNGATAFFAGPAGANPNFQITPGATTVIDRGVTTEAPTNDIGFDPRCIRQQTGQAVAFWQYVPDYTYIQSIGGVAGCFHPNPRPQGALPDLGAYEVQTGATCSTALACDDGNHCTTDSCGGTGQCNHAPIAGCCAVAADCDDLNLCTTDSCDAASGSCGHAPVAGCCLASADCNDANPCTSDGCNLATHRCTASAISRCCTLDSECTSPSACVRMTCNTAQNVCMNQVVAGCCQSATDCSDGDACTSDACDTTTGGCTNSKIAGCCALDGDCADTDDCTSDRCDTTAHTCIHTPSCGAGGAPGSGGAPSGVTGGTGPGPGAGAAGAGAGSGVDPGTGATSSPASSGGCGCSLPRDDGPHWARSGSLFALGLGLVVYRARRRRSAR